MTENTAAKDPAIEAPAVEGTGPEETTAATPRQRRKKRRTSRELRDLQKMEDGMSKAALRLSRAASTKSSAFRDA